MAEENLLSPSKHDELIRQFDRFVREARVGPEWVRSRRFKEYCTTEVERAWFRNWKRNRAEGVTGLAYFGTSWEPPLRQRMSAMVGKFTRHYCFAQLWTPFELYAAWKAEGTFPYCTVMCIDGLVAGEGHKAPAPPEFVYGLIANRVSDAKQQTVVGIPTADRLRAQYGENMAGLLSGFRGVASHV